MLLETYINLSWGLLQKKHLTNGDQWNESHAVTQPDVFDKVCKFSPNDRHRDIKGTPTHALQVNCILLSGRLYSQAHTVSIADWWYHQYASYWRAPMRNVELWNCIPDTSNSALPFLNTDVHYFTAYGL